MMMFAVYLKLSGLAELEFPDGTLTARQTDAQNSFMEVAEGMPIISSKDTPHTEILGNIKLAALLPMPRKSATLMLG